MKRNQRNHKNAPKPPEGPRVQIDYYNYGFGLAPWQVCIITEGIYRWGNRSAWTLSGAKRKGKAMLLDFYRVTERERRNSLRAEAANRKLREQGFQ